MQLIADLVARVRTDVDSGKLSLFHKQLGEETQAAAGKGASGLAGFVSSALPLAAVVGAGTLVAGAIWNMTQAAAASQAVMAQTNAVLASTKGAAGVSAQAVTDLASQLMGLSGADDEAIQGAENMLLTFTSIGKDTFPGATRAVLDMSTAMNGGLTPSADQLRQTAIQVGKALNDPIQGVTALRKVGVQLTDDQQKLIATMMKHNDVAGAQAVILKELGTEFGGAAKAAGGTFNGQLALLGATFGNLQEAIGGAFLPVMQQLVASFVPVITQIASFVTTLTSSKDGMEIVKGVAIAAAVIFGGVLAGSLAAAAVAAWSLVAGLLPFIAIGVAVAAAIGGLAFAVKYAYDNFQPFHDAVNKLGAALKAGLAAAVAFLTPLVQQAQVKLSEFGKEIMERAGPAVKNLAAFIQGAMQVISAVWTAVWPFLSEVLRNTWQVIQGIVQVAWSIISGIIKIGLDILGGNWRGAWNDMKAMLAGVWSGIQSIASGAVGNLVAIIRGAIGLAGAAMGAIGNAITGAIAGLGGRLAQLARDAISAMISAIRGMAGAVGSAIGGLFSHFHIPGFASGGVMEHSGFAMVGERGPELVALPQGAQVYPHGASPLINTGAPRVSGGSSAGGNGATRDIVLTLNGREIARELLPDFVGEMQLSGIRIG